MTNLLKLPGKEKLTFSSEKSISELKKDMQLIFDKRALDFTSQITGQFYGDNAFWASTKWLHFVTTNTPPSNKTIITGKILSSDGSTTIKAIIKPNFIFYFFAIIFPIIALITLISIIYSEGLVWNESILTVLILLVVSPAAGIFYSHISKEELKNKFIKSFNLKQVIMT